MSLRRAATSAAAAVVGTGLTLLGAPLAQAATSAPAAITVPAVINSGQATNVNGTCPTAATKAALRATAGTSTLFAKTYAVTGGEWAGVVTATGPMGDVTVSLACTAGTDTVGTATAGVLLFAVADDGRANVAVSPTSRPLGGTVTVSAACPKGSAGAGVYLFQGDNDPFAGVASSPVRSTGMVTTSFALNLGRPPGSSAPAPQPGSATAVVFCTDASGMPTGTGAHDFTISRAVVSAPPPPRAGSAPQTSRATPSRLSAAMAALARGVASGALSGVVAASVAGLSTTPTVGSATALEIVPAGFTVTELADTGRNLLPLTALGMLLVGAGSGLVAGGRRRTPPLA